MQKYGNYKVVDYVIMSPVFVFCTLQAGVQLHCENITDNSQLACGSGSHDDNKPM